MMQFTRQQRRQLQKLTDKFDIMAHADKRFFERRPLRKHRVRLASQAEIDQQTLLCGEAPYVPAGCRIFVVVRKISTGARIRLFIQGVEGAETDLDEASARAIYDEWSTAKTRDIEVSVRKAVEAAA